MLQLPDAAAAVLAVPILLGPQTAAELRLICERLNRFDLISCAEGLLEELAALRECVEQLAAELAQMRVVLDRLA